MKTLLLLPNQNRKACYSKNMQYLKLDIKIHLSGIIPITIAIHKRKKLLRTLAHYKLLCYIIIL